MLPPEDGHRPHRLAWCSSHCHLRGGIRPQSTHPPTHPTSPPPAAVAVREVEIARQFRNSTGPQALLALGSLSLSKPGSILAMSIIDLIG